MDIVVQLEDGSITNVEVQRYGYAFPGQRAACYSADLLLRQYKQKRDQSKQNGNKKVNFKNIMPVYTVVFYETSPAVFKKYQSAYVHHFHQVSDTGMEMELLENYIFIPLDIFRINLQNRGINSKLDAWLAFLSVDDPEWILNITETYPEFKAMYNDVYEICLNVERVMSMFSKELLELDKNTVQYMIDEMQDEINRMKADAREKDALYKMQLSEKDSRIVEKDSQIANNL